MNLKELKYIYTIIILAKFHENLQNEHSHEMTAIQILTLTSLSNPQKTCTNYINANQ